MNKSFSCDTYAHQTLEVTTEYIKKSAKRLQKSLNHGETKFTLMQCQEMVCHSLGFESFHVLRESVKVSRLAYLAQKGVRLLSSSNQPLDLKIGCVTEQKYHLYLTPQTLKKNTLFIGHENSAAKKASFKYMEYAIHHKIPLVYFNCSGNSSDLNSILSLAKMLGREDDVLVMNFMIGEKKEGGNRFKEEKLSHTFNIFSYGSSGGLTDLLISAFREETNLIIKGRLISLLSSLMMALVYLRDEEKKQITFNTIQHYLILENLVNLYHTRPDLPEHIKNALKAYLTSLFGFKTDNHTVCSLSDITPVSKEQHGYVAMPLINFLNSLSNSYDYIFNTQFSEINLSDIIENNRILIISMPSLEKSSVEYKKLFHFMHGSIKLLQSYAVGKRLSTDSMNEDNDMPKMMIFNNGGIELVNSILPLSQHPKYFSFVYLESELPKTTVFNDMTNCFYFKGEYLTLNEDNQRMATKLKPNCCIYKNGADEIFLDIM